MEEEEVPAQRKGSNLRVKLKLTLEDIVNGVKKKIKVNKLFAAEGVEFTTAEHAMVLVKLQELQIPF